ncbi:MAG: 4-oxalocrotonate tautomerase DmpI [Promethearchaeota archaeon]
MPSIIIEGPKLEDIDIKRMLVEEITNVVVKAYKIPKEHVMVLIKENSSENVGTGGILIADLRKK